MKTQHTILIQRYSTVMVELPRDTQFAPVAFEVTGELALKVTAFYDFAEPKVRHYFRAVMADGANTLADTERYIATANLGGYFWHVFVNTHLPREPSNE